MSEGQIVQVNQSDHSKENNVTRDWQGGFAAILLSAILVLGAVFRLTGVNWDQDQHLHPDERHLTMVESAISFPGTRDNPGVPPPGCPKWGGYFNTPCSPLSPYNHNFGLFVYGTFPIFLTQAAGELLHQTGYGEIHLVGRVLSALFDLATVLLIFLIGRRIYGMRAALLGALFLAASVLNIQQSHFFTVDTFTNVPILIAFWYVLDIADRKEWPSFVYAGSSFGLALAGRINIAPFAIVLIAAAALRAYRSAQASQRAREAKPPPAPDAITQAEEDGMSDAPVQPHALSFEDYLAVTSLRAFVGLAGAALVALIVFRVGQPYAANGPNFLSPSLPQFDLSHGAVNALFDVALSWAGGVNEKFAANMTYISELVAGRQDFPPGHQWTNRTSYLFPLQNMVLWGLGLPLGIAAWAGFVVASYRLVRYREWRHLLIVVWVGVTFAYTGQQWVKTMRYFLQIYPFLALLAGYFIVTLWDKASAGRQLYARVGAAIIAGVVIVYTLFWAGAFTTIYTRPVSRVTASRWMLQNIPPGSVIGNEHWDDPLPLRVDGKDPFGGMYRSLSSSPDSGELQWYDEDTPEKRARAIRWLDEAEYIVLSSNRLYGSIPRLPMRYPMTTRYYQWLFDGTLGIEELAEFTSRPNLFGIEMDDDDAEEAFTVYDHPKVLIFKKTPRYSHANTEKLFSGVDLTEVYRFWPREATQAPTALLLTPTEWDAQLRGGTWSQIFNPDDWINRIPVAGWLVMIEILGLLAFPIAFVAFRGLADRGYILSKVLGILLPAWGAWMLASVHVLPFSRTSILAVTVVIAFVSGLLLWWRRRDIGAFLLAQRATVLIEEILFLAFFGAFLLIRYGNPDLWHQWFGGEKPMDFAYLNAIVRSTWFPPYDPWFAGGYINYYYFGHLITAVLIRLSGIVPEVAYNLALPMFFAMTALGAFSVAFNLVWRNTRAWRFAFLAGILAALFVAVMGNLGELLLIGQTLLKIGGGENAQSFFDIMVGASTGVWRVLVERRPFEIPIGWWYWNASRVIPETINEFPVFTFLYADLHAHLMALPFTLLALGLAVNFALREPGGAGDVRLPVWPRTPISPMDIVEVIIASLALGALRAINFADFPTYLLVILCALAIGEYARRQRIDREGIVAAGWRAIAILVFSTLLYQPFISHFATAYLSIEPWNGDRSELGEYLVVYGIGLFIIATFLIRQTFDTGARRAVLVEWAPLLIAALLVFEAAFVFTRLMVFTLAFPLLVLAGLLVLRLDLDPARRLVALLIAAGLAMTMMVEVVVYKGDIGRMNTVFKFYLQVWVFFGIAAAAAVVFLMRTAAGTQPEATVADGPPMPVSSLPKVWWAIVGLLMLAGLAYPVFATRAKVNDRFVMGSPAGLNGMDYLRTAIYPDRDYNQVLEYDRQAIGWLRANVEGSPVILEGNAPLYHWASRVSIYTGLPAVIGWDWHQKQQRSIIDGAIIDRRLEAVRTIYNTRDINDALARLSRFRVSYIYVGDLEHAFYDAQGLTKFDAMVRAGQLQVAYENERVKIYRVRE